jgi:hypothetical protein
LVISTERIVCIAQVVHDNLHMDRRNNCKYFYNRWQASASKEQQALWKEVSSAIINVTIARE